MGIVVERRIVTRHIHTARRNTAAPLVQLCEECPVLTLQRILQLTVVFEECCEIGTLIRKTTGTVVEKRLHGGHTVLLVQLGRQTERTDNRGGTRYRQLLVSPVDVVYISIVIGVTNITGAELRVCDVRVGDTRTLRHPRVVVDLQFTV